MSARGLSAACGWDKPVGLVVNHILDELSHSKTAFSGMPWQNIRDGGFKIYTTIDAQAQAAAVAAADGTAKTSAVYWQPQGLQAAPVAGHPGTGPVVPHYGG